MVKSEIVYGLAFFAVALVILLINWQKRRHVAKEAAAPGTSGTARAYSIDSWKSVAFLVFFVMGFYLAYALLPKNALRVVFTIAFIVPAVGLLLLLWYARGLFVVLWQYARALFGAQRPLWITTDKDGQKTMNCPKCGATVNVEDIQQGSLAFKCEACGETGNWT